MISSPQNSVLFRRSLQDGPELSSLQAEIDGKVARFVEEASDGRTLASLVAGSLAYRFVRVGVMGLRARSTGLIASWSRPLSIGTGLLGEVTAFEGSLRTMAALSGNRSNPRLWRLSGTGGWGPALASDLITFGMLKGGAYLSRETNLIFQHTFSSTLLVAGHLRRRVGVGAASGRTSRRTTPPCGDDQSSAGSRLESRAFPFAGLSQPREGAGSVTQNKGEGRLRLLERLEASRPPFRRSHDGCLRKFGRKREKLLRPPFDGGRRAKGRR